MKRRCTIALLGFLAFVPVLAHADHDKLDLMLRGVADDLPAAKAMLGKSMAADAVGESIEVLIKSADVDLTASAVEEVGGRVTTVAGDIMVATLPSSALALISDRDEVLYIEASKRLSMKLDTARVHTKADLAQAGTVTGSALTGKEVIVGVVDDSFDYGHDDFKGSDGKTRVQFVRQRKSDGTYNICVKSQIDDTKCSITDGGQGGFHGTHVTGIATSANSTYKGVAPDADIMFVVDSTSNPATNSSTDVTTFSGSVLDAVTTIFAGADLLKKPAVVNLSLGTSLGAHDDTSLLEQGLNNLVGKAGRVIVNAAGNENVNAFASDATNLGGIHGTVSVAANTARGWRFLVRNADVATSAGSVIADMWFGTGESCTVETRAYLASAASATGSTRAIVGPSNIGSDATATQNDGTAALALSTDNADANNNRPHAQVTVSPVSGASFSSIISNGATGYLFDIVIRATTASCSGHLWLYPDRTDTMIFLKNVAGSTITGTSYTLVDGDSNNTATIPSTASGVISVGSFKQEKPVNAGTSRWTDVNGTVHDQTDNVNDSGTGGTVGAISPFSSLGPTGEISGARTKPDIIAPGEPILSTLARGASIASSLKPDATHLKLEGTSMSSPHVTGLVALLLQYNNTLTASQVKDLLKTTATAVAGGSANIHGSGKVDVQAALKATSANTGGFSGTRDTCTSDVSSTGFQSSSSCSESSSGSSSTCSLVEGGDRLAAGLGLLLLAIAFAVILHRRKKNIY